PSPPSPYTTLFRSRRVPLHAGGIGPRRRRFGPGEPPAVLPAQELPPPRPVLGVVHEEVLRRLLPQRRGGKGRLVPAVIGGEPGDREHIEMRFSRRGGSLGP